MSASSHSLSNDHNPAIAPDTNTANRGHRSSSNSNPHSYSQFFDHFFDHVVHAPSRSRRNSPLRESYFEDSASPSPSSPFNFLDTILNPQEPAYLPFGYRRQDSSPPPPGGTGRSPLPQRLPDFNEAPMPSSRPSRLPNGYVDLTSEPDVSAPAPVPLPVLAPPSPPQRRPKRSSPTPGPSSKRMKRNDGTASASTSQAKSEQETSEKIEEIDLSDEKIGLQDILQKQRADAVKAQQKPEEKATTFNTFTCVICMDTPTDITATSCGHLFCHTCLMEALIAGENRSGPNEPKRSQCPVCRKFINRTKQTDIIPLLLKKGLATQPTKSSVAKSSAKAPFSKVL